MSPLTKNLVIAIAWAVNLNELFLVDIIRNLSVSLQDASIS